MAKPASNSSNIIPARPFANKSMSQTRQLATTGPAWPVQRGAPPIVRNPALTSPQRRACTPVARRRQEPRGRNKTPLAPSLGGTNAAKSNRRGLRGHVYCFEARLAMAVVTMMLVRTPSIDVKTSLA